MSTAPATCCARPQARFRLGPTATSAGSAPARNGLRRWRCASTTRPLRATRSRAPPTASASPTAGPGSTRLRESFARAYSFRSTTSPRTRRPASRPCRWSLRSAAPLKCIRVKARFCSHARVPTGPSRSAAAWSTVASSRMAAEADVRAVAASDPTAAALLNAYATEIHENGVARPPDRVETIAAEYEQPHGTFLVVYEGDKPVACGGVRGLGEGTAEVKRMYVVPEARGNGVGKDLLRRLEEEARRLGYKRLRLDTAASLTTAQALYRAAGYAEIDDYNGNPAASHWFEKELGRSQAALVWLALGSIYFIWGSTYLAIRVMVETVPPLLGAGFRFLIAGAIFYVVLVLRRGRSAVRFNVPELLSATAAGTLLCFGGNGLVTVAEQKVPSGIAATLIASVPLWIILFRRISQDPINRIALLGVLIGFAGVGVLMLPGERPKGLTVGPMLVVVIAAASWAIGSYYPRRWPLPGDTMLSTALQMLTSGAIMVVVGAVFGEFGKVDPGGFSTKSIAGFIWLVTAGSLVAYTAYTWLLKNAPISRVATYAYVNPVVAIFLGWLLLDESITATIVVGATLIVASVALVVSRESG